MSDTASDIEPYLNDQEEFLDGGNYDEDVDNDTNYDVGGNENDDDFAHCVLKDDDINNDELEDGMIFMDAEGNYYYQPLKAKLSFKASKGYSQLAKERKPTLSPNQTELKVNLSSLSTKSTTTNKSPHEPGQACSTKQDTNTEITSKSEIKLSNIEFEKCSTAVITSSIKMEPTDITSFITDPPAQPKPKENLNNFLTKSTSTPTKSPHKPNQVCRKPQDSINSEITSKSEMKLSTDTELEKYNSAVITTSSIKIEPTEINSFIIDPPSPTQTELKENLNSSSTKSTSTRSKSPFAPACSAKNTSISSKPEMKLSRDIELKKSPSAGISSSIKIEPTEITSSIKIEPTEITSSIIVDTVIKIEKSDITSTPVGKETITSEIKLNDEEICEFVETEGNVDDQDDPDYQNETDYDNDSDYVPETNAEIIPMSPPKVDASGRYQCTKCAYNTDKKLLLSRHLKTHSEERPYKCSMCDKRFTANISLVNHINVHLGKKPHQCADCDKSFTTSGQLSCHRKYRHSDIKPYKCTECDYCCVELSRLQRHMCSHTGKWPYQCPHCPYVSSDTSSMKRHMRKHTGEKPYECDICHSRFSDSYLLKKHRWVHSYNDKPILKCILCPAEYFVKSQLRLHIQKQHDTDNPVTCKFCDKVLPDRYSYRVHVKIHDGEKYRCKLCPYVAKFKYILDKHMAVHTSEMPFNCELCGKPFRHKVYLNRHIKAHHSENNKTSAYGKNGRRYPHSKQNTDSKQNVYEAHTDEEDELTPLSPNQTKPKDNLNNISTKSTSTASKSTNEPAPACSAKLVGKNTAISPKSEMKPNSDIELSSSIIIEPTEITSSIKFEPTEITSSIKFDTITKTEKSDVTSTVRDETTTSEINNDKEIYVLDETERNVDETDDTVCQKETKHNSDLEENVVEPNAKIKRARTVKPDASGLYQCMVCAYNTDNKQQLSRHLKTHSEERPYKCTVCERGFKTNISLVNHINVHLGKKAHQCSDCDKSYTTSGQLACHRKYSHSSIKPYKCTECDYCCVELIRLKRHMCTHTGKRPYQCAHCSYAASDRYSLKRHMRKHTGEKPFECDICNSRFTEAYSLKKHRWMHSDNDKPVLNCSLCPATYSVKSDLRLHIEKQHDTDNPLTCKFCDKVLPDRYSYRKHVKIHEGEKHRCKLCPFATKFKSDLERHVAVHSDVMPFNCELCGKLFRQKEYLNRHTKVRHSENYKASAHCEENGDSIQNVYEVHVVEEGELTPLSPSQIRPKENLNSLATKSTPSNSSYESGPACNTTLAVINTEVASKSEVKLNSDIELEKYPSAEITSSIKIEPTEITSANNIDVVTKIEKSDATSETRDETITLEINNDEVYEFGEKNQNIDKPDDPVYQEETNNSDFEENVVETKAKIKRRNTLKPDASGRYQCMMCSYNTDKKYLLLRHLRNYSKKHIHKCSVCERVFKTNSLMEKHINIHLGKKHYQCMDCDKSFSQSGQLSRHRKYIHSGIKPYKCTECDYRSVELNKVQCHMRRHTGERPYQCPHCSYATSDRFRLKRHMKTHTGEKPYECDICYSRFTQTYSLKKHRLIHSVNDKPVFQCNLCPTTCGRKTDLRLHIEKQHDTDNPVTCKFCDKELPDRYSYKMHVRTHEGEKCYRCDICSYATKFKNHLDKHMPVHSGAMDFNCELCGKRFRQKEYLNRHIKAHHLETRVASAQRNNGRRYPHSEANDDDSIQYVYEVHIGEEDELSTDDNTEIILKKEKILTSYTKKSVQHSTASNKTISVKKEHADTKFMDVQVDDEHGNMVIEVMLGEGEEEQETFVEEKEMRMTLDTKM